MKLRYQLAFVALAVLLLAALVGYYATNDTDTPVTLAADVQPGAVIDRRPLQIAQRLQTLASTPEEKELAAEGVRVGDHSVDLAFTIALLQAAEHPQDSTPEIRQLRDRLDEAARLVAEDSTRLAQLMSQGRGKPASSSLDTQVELTKAQLELHRGDLADAKDDLLRAGGDPQGRIRQMVADHDSADHAGAAARPVSNDSTARRAPDRSLLGEIDRWRTVRRKQRILDRVQQETTTGIATLTMQRQSFAQHVDQVQAAPADDALARTRHLSNDQKVLAAMTRRVEDQVSLLDIYSRWAGLVTTQRRAVVHDMFLNLVWLLLILLVAVGIGAWLERLFQRLAPERRRLHTLRTVAKFTVRGLAAVGVALVLIGPPSQLATILGLAGAGLTVALKDFIVGFFGWFALMGKNGIRLGDWVEINGVSGEVVEITPFHTVLLETGNWTEAGHPTGRRVTFSNGFAIEGHYFNFSTSGQWLWDEVELVLPVGEAFPIIDAIRKIVTDETSENARLAEQEWSRASATRSVSGFSAAPAIDVRPGADGMHVVVRYVTRAQDRHQLRTHLYQAAVDLLGRPRAPAESASATTAPRDS